MVVTTPASHGNSDVQPPSKHRRVLGFAFRMYKTIVSPVLHAIAPSRCLFVPTCSEYAYVAFSRFGIRRGSWMAFRRIARCHPWGKGGLDSVPERCVHGGLADGSPLAGPDSEPLDHLS